MNRRHSNSRETMHINSDHRLLKALLGRTSEKHTGQLGFIRKMTQHDPGPAKTCQYGIKEISKDRLRAGDESWKCGLPSKSGSSWCEDHYKIVWRAPKKETE